ncbi:hypothetical protein A2397_03650 [Candidatus Amesbacteria bacterium RIFOXYB1_FULL_44_23]|uniref:DUF5680 domain-containing protein n=1 Tax=Candidatus Amesbacteria bacterium RIFOXYB1_FULL_44_23 TaxID=1797263 RepID=A0A1F4ZQE5_9BACT|nr:MAG: hypothetical protein A2397_03650 [Candidatus Amesbacteria bacterium RIFOXYB1_FULL_44_23]
MIEKKELFDFVDRAGKATYAGGGSREINPERPDFIELVYDKELPWYYRDSYTGHSRSGGQEVVRVNDKPVWWSGYGGGMVEGKESMSGQTFDFLKKALSQDEEGFESLRGPHEFTDGKWKYTYTQEGDITDFYGYEEISYKGEKCFGIEP